ncbi:unnamed protein product [Sphagnum jensenii]|uniref:UNC93-like protein n=1 Tax=Sphagnum jensenii TaxID=128206 RepID=A0ABP1B8I0_9BRYO
MDANWRSAVRDLHVLSLSFFFVFLAYGAIQNLESSLLKIDGLGSTSLAVLYLSLTISSLGAPFVVMRLGSKNAILFALSGYWIFIVANLFPSWYTMIPASIYEGFTGSILWVAQGTYLTFAAKSHAAVCNITEATAIGNFNGQFWSLFASNQVIGNLITLALLQFAKSSSVDPSMTTPGVVQLFIVFLGSMAVGTVFACLLRPHDQICTSEQPLLQSDSVNSVICNRSFVKSGFSLLFEKKMLLLILIFLYMGLQRAFIWGDFTRDIITPAFGVSWVGGVMAVYSAADAIGSLVAGKYSTGLVSIAIITSAGAITQAVVLIIFFWKQEYTTGWTDCALLVGLSIAWGVGDATFQTQIGALLGILYPHDTEAAFAQLKIWESAGTSVAFFVSTHMDLVAKQFSLLSILVVSTAALLVVVLRPESANSLKA